MNQYTVLLVDDEEEVFQVIMKKLDWESMGFSIAGYARNGVEALEMAEELQPDVVMTDVIYGRTYTLQKAQRTLPESESDHFLRL